MSIAILNQVYDEVRRLAIAGSNLAGDDFRLKKLIEPLNKAGDKAPVFAKVAQAADKLVNSKPQDSAEALLELSTLVTAILYTQGQTGADGKAAAIPTTEVELTSSNASARVLKPLLEALTTTGSGRLEIIRDAHQRGAFKDLRLVRPALQAIDDPYGEIGDLVADEILPVYGTTIYAEIRAPFDHKGRGGHVRRLRLMHHLDPEGTKDLVDEALDSGSKEMKIAALACLKGRPEALPHLLDQVTARSKDVRQTALESLAEFQEQEAVDALIKALGGKDLSLVAHHVSKNESPQVLSYLLDEADRLLEEITTTKSKEKRAAALSRFHELLSCFDARTDNKSLGLLGRCYDQLDEFAKLKGKHIDGEDVNSKVTMLMVRSGSKPLRRRLVDDADQLTPDLFDRAFAAAAALEKPATLYDRFKPYLMAQSPSKKRNDPVALKKEVVRHGLMELQQSRDALHPRRYIYSDYYGWRHFTELYGVSPDIKLDDRWLDAAVQLGDLDLVMTLARPGHKPTNDFLTKQFKQQLKKKDWHYETFHSLQTMARTQHPQVVDHFCDALEKMGRQKTRYYGFWWIGQIVADLPREAAPRIEELIPQLPEPMVDDLVPYLTDLKARK